MNSVSPVKWETIIGIEIHTELNTRSKLFSSALNRFGDEPNTNISEVCTGQPGALPVLNKEAVKKAVQFGCAIHAQVATFSQFDRKSYFYPDSPRNFQITQFYHPIIIGGEIVALVGDEEKTFSIDRAHLEDDAGMLKHFSSFAGVDYNRAGVPLLEIVSKPCIHSPKEASAYAMAIRRILDYLDVSDCNMEEGSFRMDVNVSVRPLGEKGLRNKIEIKNMNSFAFMEMALEGEIQRQIDAYTKSPQKDPGTIIQPSTYRWDPESKTTVLMRRKEGAEDYRYTTDPDLVPIVLSSDYIEAIRESLPELPHSRQNRYLKEGLHPEIVHTLIHDKSLSNYFENASLHTQHLKTLSNWIAVEFLGRFKDKGKTLSESLEPENVAKLVNLIESGTITGKIAKKVADDMVETGKDCEKIVRANPAYQPLDDAHAIEKIVEEILAENETSIQDFRAGKQKAFGFLVGQVMKKSGGKAPPQMVNELLQKKLSP